jgi:hypothetical protein
MVMKVVRALPFFGVKTTPTRHAPAVEPVTNFFVTTQTALLVFVSRLTVAPFGTFTLNAESSARNATFCPIVKVGVPAADGVDDVEPDGAGTVGEGVVGSADFSVSEATVASGLVTRGGCSLGTRVATSTSGTMNDKGVNDHDVDSTLVPPAVVRVAATT